jgi:hypothetical protein
MVRSILLGDGMAEREMLALDLETRSNADLVALLRQRLARREPPASIPSAAPTPAWVPVQRIIPMEGLRAALEQGWHFRAALPNNEAIVEQTLGGGVPAAV